MTGSFIDFTIYLQLLHIVITVTGYCTDNIFIIYAFIYS